MSIAGYEVDLFDISRISPSKDIGGSEKVMSYLVYFKGGGSIQVTDSPLFPRGDLVAAWRAAVEGLPSPAPSGASEKGWLIEILPNCIAYGRSSIQGPCWLMMEGACRGATTDSLEAIRFAREVDAQTFINYAYAEVLDQFKATEHVWG
jgi:hypothetical protein